MASITTTDVAVIRKGESRAKSALQRAAIDGEGVAIYGDGTGYLYVSVNDTVNGQSFGSAQSLFDYINANFFFNGDGGGGGVQSVTGDGVGGTPENPVLSYPTPGDIGAATSAQGELADTAVQPAAIANVVRSQQEGSVGTVISNIIAMTQQQYDELAVKNPASYYIITD